MGLALQPICHPDIGYFDPNEPLDKINLTKGMVWIQPIKYLTLKHPEYNNNNNNNNKKFSPRLIISSSKLRCIYIFLKQQAQLSDHV